VIFAITGLTMTASASQLLQNLPHTTLQNRANGGESGSRTYEPGRSAVGIESQANRTSFAPETIPPRAINAVKHHEKC
ncbi:hypothetical protein ACVSQB_23185, partial [Bradyrhizobium elkanii]